MNAKRFITLAISVLLVSCTTMPQTPIQLEIEASKKLNEDVVYSSLPVRIKIYQLNDATRFNEATFRQLWKSDISILGSTLLEKKELTINPGTKQIIRMQRKSRAEYIAAVGVFRHHDHNQWKSIKPLPGQLNTLLKKVTVTANHNQVEIQ
jgi:type VI secretion system protein VasD